MNSPRWRSRRTRIGQSQDETSHPLASSFEALLKNKRFESPSEFVSVINLWSTLVGDRMKAHATPVKIEGNELIVYVDHPAWATELKLMNSKVIARLKSELETTSIIRLKVYVRAATDVD
jgi:hypothetical protein